MPKVSVIIPCYNQGAFLDEAVNSVLSQTFLDFEIIVVNDGSTDDATNRLLANYNKLQTRVLHIPNQGLSEARNTGIREARGKYILPLDADDRIAPDYLAQAVEILDVQSDVGIVYCLAETFGARSGLWLSPEYSLSRMLLGNLIFCSALFRRNDWELVGGYRSNMAVGYEDWDFWLSIVELGRKVCRIPQVLFYYRVKEGSMAASMDATKKAEMHLQIMRNHRDLFVENSLPLLTFYYRVTGSCLYQFMKVLKLPHLIGQLMSVGKRGRR
jgi:glycosyltransferase involved in cell wall biosynthesis